MNIEKITVDELITNNNLLVLSFVCVSQTWLVNTFLVLVVVHCDDSDIVCIY